MGIAGMEKILFLLQYTFERFIQENKREERKIAFQTYTPPSPNKPVSGSVHKIPVPENPEKPSVSLLVENPLISHPVCQNTCGNALSQSPPRAF
jgi:hypothetical protein